MNIFNSLNFSVNKKVFYEVMENPDKGFGYKAKLVNSELSEIQKEVLEFLIICCNKRIIGSITINFNTEAIGVITPISRRVEKVEKVGVDYVISNSY